MILAFKRKLEQIDNFEDIKIEYSASKYFGGYSFMDFDKFKLMQMCWSKSLRYNNTQVDLEHDEWVDLKSLAEGRKESLQKSDSCKDYMEIMEIINSNDKQ